MHLNKRSCPSHICTPETLEWAERICPPIDGISSRQAGGTGTHVSMKGLPAKKMERQFKFKAELQASDKAEIYIFVHTAVSECGKVWYMRSSPGTTARQNTHRL